MDSNTRMNGSWRRRTASTPAAEAQASAAAQHDDEDSALFEDPPDLVCPVTHCLFTDPVINAAGQVYEREAIERALRTKLVDPITGVPLPSAATTTVWLLRSKALAYRERTAQACVAKACQATCQAPILYLRRAAELVQGLDGGARVAGLTPEVVSWLSSHGSSVYDFQALLRFAAALKDSGGDPSALYGRVLQTSADTGQQAAALKALLEYWGLGGDGEGEDEGRLVAKLAELPGGGEGGCSPAHFVDVLVAAQLPDSLVRRFCEHLLSYDARSCSGSGSSSSSAACAGGRALPAHAAIELLYRYTRLRLSSLERTITPAGPSGAGGSKARTQAGGPAAPADAGEGAAHAHATNHHAPRRGRWGAGRKGLRLRQAERWAFGGLFTLLATAEPRGGRLAKVIKAASLLALVLWRG